MNELHESSSILRDTSGIQGPPAPKKPPESVVHGQHTYFLVDDGDWGGVDEGGFYEFGAVVAKIYKDFKKRGYKVLDVRRSKYAPTVGKDGKWFVKCVNPLQVKEFVVPVIKVGEVRKHDNADTLSVTTVDGCPVLFRTGDLHEGDTAVYIPVDSVIPEDNENAKKFLGFLKYKSGKHRVRAIRLRGVFSMGILVAVQDADKFENANAASFFGITKFEEIEAGGPSRPGYKMLGDGCVADPHLVPVYDIESYRKFKNILVDGEDVIVTEKIHGCNSRFIHDGTQLWVGSHKRFKKDGGTDTWWAIAKKEGLEEKLAKYPMLGFFGELYGRVQDLTYGTGPDEQKLAIFDIYNAKTGVWLDWDEVVKICAELELAVVPILYRGPFVKETVEALAEGTTVAGGDHIREGIVIKPAVTRTHSNGDRYWGRVILKLVSEAYLLREGGTELH